ncbi:MAG: fasciclin domain-containing protein [Pseudomonadota bacterium]
MTEKQMLKTLAPSLLAATAAATLALAGPAIANHHKSGEGHSMVGGAAMYPAKNIVENASAAPNLKTLVAAVKAAGLVETLASPGPFTVFAPTDDAFAKLPAGTVETLVKPENKATLTSILTYHVVAGKVTAADVVALIKKGGGKAQIKTVQGGTLTASLQGQNVVLTDAKGGKSIVTQTDVMQSNGVVHVIDTVVMPG